MFQTSSSAIVSVTLKLLQDNSYIYIYIQIYITINTMILCRLNVRYKYVKFKGTNNIIENSKVWLYSILYFFPVSIAHPGCRQRRVRFRRRYGQRLL